MPPPEGQGHNVHVYLTPDVLKMYRSLENRSRFFQTALREAVGVMQWAVMKERKPDTYYDTILPDTPQFENLLTQYNQAFPLDPLTKARQKKKEDAEWLKNSQNKPELW